LTHSFSEYEEFLSGVKLGKVYGQFKKIFEVLGKRIAKVFKSIFYFQTFNHVKKVKNG